LRKLPEGSISRAMDTIEGTGAPLEPHGREGRSESSLPEPDSERATTPRERLAEADRHLLTIAAEVTALRDELARLREEANERAELLTEREVIIAELSGLLPTLEESRIDALRQAEEASAARGRAEALLAEQTARATELQAQLAAVEADAATREGLVADLEARVAEERARRGALEHELETLEAALASRVAGLSKLEAAVSHVRSEHEEVKTVAIDHGHAPIESSDLGHLRFVLREGSYTVASADGDPPVPGQLVEFNGERFTVAKIGRSPFPSDPRPCAYLLVDVGSDVAG
jgi:hypothetical protein